MADNEHDIANLLEKENGSRKSSTFDVGPGHLDFGTLSESNTSKRLRVLLTNNSGHKRTWNAGVGATEWLKLGRTFGNQISGTIRAHAQQLIDVTVDASSLEDGQYHATLHFTSNEGEKDVAVNLNVFSKHVGIVENHGGPKIREKALSFNANNKSQAQSVHLTNINAVGLNWQTTPGATWLKLSPPKGPINAGATIAIPVSVNTTGLAPGTYTAVVVFNWDPISSSSAQIKVTLVV